MEGRGLILLVDDDVRVRMLIDLVLRRAGHAVIATSSPREALLLLETRSDIDLLIADIVMPEMTGYDLAAEARTIVPGLRLLFTSGFSIDQVRGGTSVPFLPKPFSTEQLTNLVRTALQRGLSEAS